VTAVVGVVAGPAGPALATAVAPPSPVPVAAAAAAAAADGPVVVGSGFGHGRGMGQWGALGYAVDHGWDHGRVLDHFYGGTDAAVVPDSEVSVRLTGLDGRTTVSLSSSAPTVVEGRAVPAGVVSRFVRRGAAWGWSTSSGGCGGSSWSPEVVVGPAPAVWLPQAAGEDRSRLLTVCETGTAYRGNFRPVITEGTTRLVNFVRVEDYLRSVVPAESPASWADQGGGRGAAALRAQAVVARSYGLSERRWSYASTCDTTSCQVYPGAVRSGRSLEDRRSDAAVGATAGQVRARGGRVVATEFSSSTGGWSAGGGFPAVADAGDSRSPYRDWQVRLDPGAVQRAWPSVGGGARLDVLQRDGRGPYGGRVLRARVSGALGATEVTGERVRSALGLRSTLFDVRYPAPAWQKGWWLRDSPHGTDRAAFGYGLATDVELACDLDGDGRDGVVVYRDGRWDVRETATPGAPVRSFDYGGPGMTPVCGDWDGVGRDGIGVHDGSRWWLRGTGTPGPAGAVVSYGWPGATPVVGDWDGDGRDTLGVYHDGTWMLRDSLTPGRPDRTFSYGFTGAVPVPGEWAGGATTPGVYAGGRWYLRSRSGPGPADLVVDHGGAGHRPVVGDWSGRGRSSLGVTSPTS